MFGKNTKFEINTPYGWQDFHGVQKLSGKKVVDVVLESGKQISVSTDHRFNERRLGYCDVSALYSGNMIKTKDGFETIISILPRYDNPDVYDAVEVGKNHCYYTNNIMSHNCEFLGSTNTLISGAKLATLAIKQPIESKDFLDVYELPQPKRTYVITVDVAEGQGLDYSSFSVFDVTEIPYRQIAKYRNNEIPPLLFPTVIYSVARRFNDAFILVEINSIGLQVADILHFELGYENLLKFQIKGKQGTQASGGFGAGKNKIAFGLKMSVQTKNIGCANLKALVENDKLLICDADTIIELSSFSANKKSFTAEEGSNDDLAMTLVHFGWLTSQRLFKETVSNDIRAVLQAEQMDILDRELVPFGFIDNGLNEPLNERDANGDLWVSEREKLYPFDDFNYTKHTNW
jgi:hypothetical protein